MSLKAGHSGMLIHLKVARTHYIFLSISWLQSNETIKLLYSRVFCLIVKELTGLTSCVLLCLQAKTPFVAQSFIG